MNRQADFVFPMIAQKAHHKNNAKYDRSLSGEACTPPDTSKSPPTAYCSSQLKQVTYLIRLKKEENKLEIRHGRIRVQCLIFDYKAFGQFGVF